MFIILISGASGSGKTTIVNTIKKYLDEKTELKSHIISVDQFYKSMHPHESRNWDHISAINFDLLYHKIKELSVHHKVLLPDYDYITHQSIPDAIKIEENLDILFIEGIFALYDKRLRELAHLKIFIEADPLKNCLQRRFHRDVVERGRSGESILDQYIKQVIPGFEEFVLPTKKYADLCIPNENEKPTIDSTFIKIIITFLKINLVKSKSFSYD